MPCADLGLNGRYSLLGRAVAGHLVAVTGRTDAFARAYAEHTTSPIVAIEGVRARTIIHPDDIETHPTAHGQWINYNTHACELGHDPVPDAILRPDEVAMFWAVAFADVQSTVQRKDTLPSGNKTVYV